MRDLKNEIQISQNTWEGGFLTKPSKKRNQVDIQKYLKDNLKNIDCLLEIGPGRGFWSKYIYELNSVKKQICVDILSAEHNDFWNYVGKNKKNRIQYNKLEDFNLDFIPDNSLDYVFSYDACCHISYSGISAYLKILKKKCKKNCKLFIMYADPKKYLNNEPENIFHVHRFLPYNNGISLHERKINGLQYSTGNYKKISDTDLIKQALDDRDGKAIPYRWYWIGIDNFVDLCNTNDYKIINADLNIDKTNPITLFINK